MTEKINYSNEVLMKLFISTRTINCLLITYKSNQTVIVVLVILLLLKIKLFKNNFSRKNDSIKKT